MPFAIPSPMQRPGEPHKNAMGNKKGPPTVGWGPLEDTAGGAVKIGVSGVLDHCA
jgi:hypothetical protein